MQGAALWHEVNRPRYRIMRCYVGGGGYHAPAVLYLLRLAAQHLGHRLDISFPGGSIDERTKILNLPLQHTLTKCTPCTAMKNRCC